MREDKLNGSSSVNYNKGVFSFKKYKIQNVNYFGMVECKMLKFSGSYLVPSKLQNLLP
jgi:hypothetical protein